MSLLSKILGNDNNCFCDEDKIEFLQHMKFLLLPFNLNKCLNERLLASFLESFDNFLNRMVLLKTNDLLVVKEYNKELFEIVS